MLYSSTSSREILHSEVNKPTNSRNTSESRSELHELLVVVVVAANVVIYFMLSPGVMHRNVSGHIPPPQLMATEP